MAVGMIKQYLYNVFLTLDQSFNVIFLLGDPDVSVSSHCALAMRVQLEGRGRMKWFVPHLAGFVDWLFHNQFWTIEEDHVFKAYEPHECNHKALWKWYVLEEKNG